MNKEEVLRIIESTLKSGDKTPGLFDLPKILGIKSQLESCTSVADVTALLEEHRSLVTKAFGLSDETFDGCLEKLKTLSALA